MDNKLPNLQRLRLEKLLKPTTFAILLINRGMSELRIRANPWALERYALALMYLAENNSPMALHLRKQAMQGFEAAMISAFPVEDLKAFGENFRACMKQIHGIDAEQTPFVLQSFIEHYGNVGTSG